MSTNTSTLPALTTTPATPSTNPYEGGRMMTTVNCPTCDARVTVAVADIDGIRRGSIVVMHTTSEHWTRVYWGSDPARVQYAPEPEAAPTATEVERQHMAYRQRIVLANARDAARRGDLPRVAVLYGQAAAMNTSLAGLAGDTAQARIYTQRAEAFEQASADAALAAFKRHITTAHLPKEQAAADRTGNWERVCSMPEDLESVTKREHIVEYVAAWDTDNGCATCGEAFLGR